MADERYWIDTTPHPNPFSDDNPGEGVAVVDELRGGVVAYFGREEDALEYLDIIKGRNKSA